MSDRQQRGQWYDQRHCGVFHPGSVKAPARVLVVDDDPLMRVIAAQFFRCRGADILDVAGDGLEAIGILDASEAHPGLILCNLNMPNIDGLQFLRLLRERNFTGPIVILSGEDHSILALAEKLALSHRLNIVAALRKPLQPRQLESVLNRLGRRARDTIDEAGDDLVDESDLRQALSLGRIVAHYQPKTKATSGLVAGVEALARWHDPDRGWIAPSVFVRLAERCGLIARLTDTIAQCVAADASHLLRLRPQLTIAVNISACLLEDVGFPDRICALLTQHGLPTSSFILEITESRAIEPSAASLEVLTRLFMHDFTLSIDDFGTGRSNLEELTRFPFREIKIDRQYAGNVLSSKVALACVESSILLAKRLGLAIVGEGIETAATAHVLAQLGVDELQGYHISPPLAFDRLLAFVVEHGCVANAPLPAASNRAGFAGGASS